MTITTLVPGKLTVAVFTGFEPFAFWRDGELIGFDIDLLRAFAQAANLELCFVVKETFEGIWYCPGRGEVDLATAGIASFDERTDASVAWSVPYFDVLRSILVPRNRSGELAHIDRFENCTIAFVQGSSADLDTRARAPGSATLLPVEHQTQGMELLRAGAIDGLAMGAPSNAYNQRLHPEFALVDVHEFSQSEGLRFPVSASNTVLLAKLDQFIHVARQDGTIERALAHWMSQGAVF